MPLYEYQCPKCKDNIEILQRGFEEKKPPFCTKCSKNKKLVIMKRMISRNEFHLKGDGWYKDHYGLKEKKK